MRRDYYLPEYRVFILPCFQLCTTHYTAITMENTGKDPLSTNTVITENHKQKRAPRKDYRMIPL